MNARNDKPRAPFGAKKGRGKGKFKKNKRDMLDEKRSRHLEGVKVINYRDYELLRKFMTEQGKMMPRRITGANAKQQRQIRQAIRRARNMGLLR
ncbi:MAG: 30S ribosomal protein S18 [Lentisphaerae bacterium]|nr:30S ribosomal protein S18 [Lentisphaerota bacterium]